MTGKYTLFIDESGNLNIPNSRLYILCGCAIQESWKHDLKIHADQIKFKYWGSTDIVFHSREIGSNEGDFSIFKGKEDLKKQFIKDLFFLLKKWPFMIFPVVVDKKRAEEINWDKDKIIDETAHQVIYNFIALLLTRGKVNGRIIIESSSAEKDRRYLSTFSYFLSPGAVELNVDHSKLREILTSISFVTKKNNDIEEQISDLFAYAAACKYEKEYTNKRFSKNGYEDSIVKILDTKLFQTPSRVNDIKKELFEKIDPFCVLPEMQR
jgi:hypothetical protein